MIVWEPCCFGFFFFFYMCEWGFDPFFTRSALGPDAADGFGCKRLGIKHIRPRRTCPAFCRQIKRDGRLPSPTLLIGPSLASISEVSLGGEARGARATLG